MAELKNPGPIEFEAKIQSGSGGGAWVDFPFDIKETYGRGNLVPFKAVFDDRVEYRGSLAKMGGDCAMVLLRKDIREQIGKQPGDTVQVRIEVDATPRTVKVPKDFQVALSKTPVAKEVFDKFAFTHKREYVRWIEEAKRPETRASRVEKSIEMIKNKQKMS